MRPPMVLPVMIVREVTLESLTFLDVVVVVVMARVVDEPVFIADKAEVESGERVQRLPERPPEALGQPGTFEKGSQRSPNARRLVLADHSNRGGSSRRYDSSSQAPRSRRTVTSWPRW